MKAHLERMVRSMAWADREVCAALRDHPAAQAEGLPLLAHMLGAEHVWLARLEQREPRHAVWPPLALPDCEQLASENADGYARFLAGLSEADLATPVRYRNTKGDEFSTPVIDILTQVLLHGAYHRGQVARAMGRAGAQAAGTDYITFTRLVEPATS